MFGDIPRSKIRINKYNENVKKKGCIHLKTADYENKNCKSKEYWKCFYCSILVFILKLSWNTQFT